MYRNEITAGKPKLPEAIGIGCRRCGSSWLHEVLNRHPHIGKPQNGLHYFSQFFGRGAHWYADALAPHNGRKILMEFSVSYTYPEYYEACAERIYQYNPLFKIFVLLRNPIERAYSDYLRSLRLLEIPKSQSFEDAIMEHPVFLERGLYGKILKPYFERFNTKQILIMNFNELNSNPASFTGRLFDFLGVFRLNDMETLNNAAFRGKKVRSQRVNSILYGIKRGVDHLSMKFRIDQPWGDVKSKYKGIYHKVLSLNEKNEGISKDTYDRLTEYYKDDLALLHAISDFKLSL